MRKTALGHLHLKVPGSSSGLHDISLIRACGIVTGLGICNEIAHNMEPPLGLGGCSLFRSDEPQKEDCICD